LPKIWSESEQGVLFVDFDEIVFGE